MRDPTSRAADLAEQLVEEVARPDQDWQVIHTLALELAELAAEVLDDERPSSER